MFGDIFHGFILFSFGIYLCSLKLYDIQYDSLFNVRYLFLLMGFFSLYCGIIYNDMTSIPLKLFGDSCYIKQDNNYI
jgi:V-type H+-transporting ATPase subunit a